MIGSTKTKELPSFLDQLHLDWDVQASEAAVQHVKLKLPCTPLLHDLLRSPGIVVVQTAEDGPDLDPAGIGFGPSVHFRRVWNSLDALVRPAAVVVLGKFPQRSAQPDQHPFNAIQPDLAAAQPGETAFIPPYLPQNSAKPLQS